MKQIHQLESDCENLITFTFLLWFNPGRISTVFQLVKLIDDAFLFLDFVTFLFVFLYIKANVAQDVPKATNATKNRK